MRPQTSLTIALAANITAGGVWSPAVPAATTRDIALAASVQAEPAPARTFELRIQKQALVGGPATLRVLQGERVQIALVSDEPMTLHLHGYDIETTILPGRPARMSFQAMSTGRFPLAAHIPGSASRSAGSHREKMLLYLEVHPR